MTRATIIAEAGVNHDGDVAKALALVDAAAAAGADVVKFQTFRADALATAAAAKADYQVATTGAGSQRDMLRALELDEAAHVRLFARCRERGIEFLSTPFDPPSLDLLLRLGVARIKVGSGDLTNAPLLWRIARAGKPVILSTGMADEDEIALALGALARGYAGETPRGRAALAAERGALDGRVTLLHCVSAYPADDADMNLRAIAALARRFGLPVGLSDHSLGFALAPAAVALGATMVEKHLTLDCAAPGPDHRASLEPPAFAAMVRDIRRVEAALGDGMKAPRPVELEVARAARKSLVAARAIAAGEAFSAENLAAKRAGAGASPFEYLGSARPQGDSRLRARRAGRTVSGGIVVVGAGDHARVVVSTLRALGLEIAGWCGEPTRRAEGDPRLLAETDVAAMARDAVELANGIGSIDRPARRRAAFERYAGLGFRFRTLVHPAAFVAAEARLGEGAQVMAQAAVQAGTALGPDSIVNTGAVVDHDCRIGAHSHVATGARLSGAVEIGEGCHVGAGATIIQYVRIGAGALVAAGAVVVRDVPPGATALGVPARVRPAAKG